jgi:hypothetical protein
MIHPVRTLPLRVPLADGEALDSWLRRLAHRNDMPLLHLATALGFGTRLRVWHNYALTWHLPASLLRRIETQTGLAPGALDTAVLDQFDPLGWKPIPGSRYCPTCLAQPHRWWPIRWQLPYTFACTTHRCLLAGLCPACARIPHSRISERSGQAPDTICTLGASHHGTSCHGGLLTHRPQQLRTDDPRLAAQQWINQRLDRMAPDAVTDLRDLAALDTWLRQRIHPTELAELGAATVTAMREFRDQHNALKRHQPTAVLLSAALASHAITVITSDDPGWSRGLAPLLRDVHSQRRTTPASSTRGPMMILSRKRLTSLSEPLQRTLLRRIDTKMSVTERLRYRTHTATPRAPATSSTAAADRARHIPQSLWPDWIVRLQSSRGRRTAQLAINIPMALLIPGNPSRNNRATTELSPWRPYISNFLTQIAARHPDVLTAICNIADHLDNHGAPIDYRRRRATFTTVNLSISDWKDMCARADAGSGRDARLRHARRYLFALLTSANLADGRHPLGSSRRDDRMRYQQFEHQTTSTLRDELRRHAEGLLAATNIDEPLTWSPPDTCAAGLTLPGRDPHDIDTTALAQLILVDNLPAQRAAHNLGVSIDHVRYTAQHLPALRRASATTAPRPDRPAEKTNQPDRAQQQRDRRVDPSWLRKQAGTLRRTNTDIAAELGLSHETIRRHRKNLNIPTRHTGTYSDRRYPHLPADVRRAVEGNRSGWQRLRRFEQVTAFHSINTAAAAHGHHAQNLNLQIQRLETDLGAQLLVRGHRYQPIGPTPRGKRLLQQLRRPAVRQLLD